MSFLARFFTRRQLLLLLFMLPIVPVSAGYLICRSDPIVTLSNGVVLTIGANIDVVMQNVSEVHYELHVPKGVTMVSEVPTPFWKKTQETFTFVADQASGQYKVITTVHTHNGGSTIIADTSATKGGVNLGYWSAQGGRDQALTVTFAIK